MFLWRKSQSGSIFLYMHLVISLTIHQIVDQIVAAMRVHAVVKFCVHQCSRIWNKFHMRVDGHIIPQPHVPACEIFCGCTLIDAKVRHDVQNDELAMLSHSAYMKNTCTRTYVPACTHMYPHVSACTRIYPHLE